MSPLARETAFLFTIDAFTNLTDYGFHVFLGRALSPGDFAIVQTINSVVFVLATTFAVMQPVVARYVAEGATSSAAGTGMTAAHIRVMFQRYFRGSTWLGLALTSVVWLARRPLAELLNVPSLAVGLSAVILLLVLLRPIISGMLQGQERFVAFGLVRSAYSVGRLVLGVILVMLGGGVLGAIAALPLGAMVAVLLGLGLLGWDIWRPGPALPEGVIREGLRLSLAGLVAYATYTSLQTMDLIWVNRTFTGELAGSYAAAVLLRRALLLLPGVAVIVMYPRIVAQVTRERLPDRLLWQTSGVILGITALLTIFYFAFGDAIVRLTFGSNYPDAGPLLGWMGVAVLGYGMCVVWLNVYLATRPGPFVVLLVACTLLQGVLLALRHETLLQTTAAFGIAGWILAIGGGAIYLLWLRPKLAASISRQT